MNKKITALICLLASSIIHPGFPAGTLIKTPSGHAAIENSIIGDLVETSEMFTAPCETTITRKYSSKVQQIACIKLEDSSTIVCSEDQLFYLPILNFWVKATELQLCDLLVTQANEFISVDSVELLDQETEVFDLALTDPHVFFVTERNIIVHNIGFVPVATVIPQIAPAITSGLAAFGTYLAFNWKHRNRNAHLPSRPPQPKAPITPEDPDEFNKKHPHGRYENAPYHHQNSGGRKSPAPKDGQAALDNSVEFSDFTPNRIGISNNEFVVLNRTSNKLYHGHVRTWWELSDDMQKALKKYGLVNYKGKII